VSGSALPGIARIARLVLAFSLLCGVFTGGAAAELRQASAAPRFALNDLHGSLVEVKSLHGKRLLVLYFFDVESRPSLEGLGALNLLARQHPEELVVYGVSSSPPELIKRYVAEHHITIPQLLDTNRVRDLYGARQVLPVGCIVGQDFKVLEYYQGGGAGFNSAIIGRIRRELQDRDRPVARTSPPEAKLARTVKKTPAKEAPALDTVKKSPAKEAPALVTVKKTPAKEAPSGQAAQAPVGEPPASEGKVQPNNLGKIIDESQW